MLIWRGTYQECSSEHLCV